MWYSQCGEDQHMIEKYFASRSNGIFLELGAMDGLKFSNTKALEDLGWRGFLIEPDPRSFENLQANRPNSICFNRAITRSKGEIIMSLNPKAAAVTSTVEALKQSEFFANKWHPKSSLLSVESSRKLLQFKTRCSNSGGGEGK